MTGTRAPSTIPAASAPARKERFFASMLPASRSGTTRTCARPATSERMPLISAASGLIALSSASGPSRRPPAIWPRSAILQSAAASIVPGIFGLTVSIAERMATRGVPSPRARGRAMTLRRVSALVSGAGGVFAGPGGEMFARAWVKKGGPGEVGHVHDEDVADAALGPEPPLLGDDLAHQLVGVQAALHQQLGPARAHQLPRPRPA